MVSPCMRSSHSCVLFSVLTACTHAVSSPPASVATDGDVLAAKVEAPVSAASQPALTPIDFAAHGLSDTGCFAVRDLASGLEQMSSPVRCAEARRPYSTFKMANALIGLDLGLLEGPDTIMRGDPVRYPMLPGFPEAWGHDQSLREAMAVSAVPLFRKLASDVGNGRMAQYLAKLDYGNRDMSGGDDRFWLDGGLRISALAQVAFVSKLVRDELGVSERAQAALRDVLGRDRIAGVPHAGKTGTGGLEEERQTAAGDGALAWMVGWIELPRGPVAYAMWVEGASVDAVKAVRTQTLDAVLGEIVTRWH